MPTTATIDQPTTMIPGDRPVVAESVVLWEVRVRHEGVRHVHECADWNEVLGFLHAWELVVSDHAPIISISPRA